MPPPLPSRADRRRGVVAVEALLAVPAVLVVLGLLVGAAELIAAQQLLAEAGGRAARVAAVGGSPEQVRAAAVAVLGAERGERAEVSIDPPAGPPGELIEVRVTLAARHLTTGLAPVDRDEPLTGRAVMVRE